MEWTAVTAIIGVITLVGLILIYAAKSIFRTKEEAMVTAKEFNAKLYNSRGITNFTPRDECERYKTESERRQDHAQRNTCDKLDKILVTQTKISGEVIKITSRFDQYLSGEIRKENTQVDILTDKIDDLITAMKKS